MELRNVGKLALLAAFLTVIAAMLFSPLGEWLSLARLKDSQLALIELIEARPLLCTTGFFLLCVAATAACFPAAPVLGIAGGALFGFWAGLLIVSIASSIGSTIAFFDSRYLFRDQLKKRLGGRLEAIDRGFQEHGAIYLLSLRLNPVIPYWLVNLAMGLTKMRVATYVPLTIAGLLPATFIYVNAGTRLASIETTAEIISVKLAAGLLLLSLLPLIANRLGFMRASSLNG